MKRTYGSPDDHRWFIPLLVVNVALIIIIIVLMIALSFALFPIPFGEGISQEQSTDMYLEPQTLQHITRTEIAWTPEVEPTSRQTFLPYIAYDSFR